MSKIKQKIASLKKIYNKREFILATGAIIALSVAFIAERFFGIKPCKLCLYERYIYLSIIGFSVSSLKFSRTRVLKYILAISLLGLSLLSFYHVLYERDYIKTSIICDSKLNLDNLSRDEIREIILKENVLDCKAPVYVFNKVSFAELNFYYSCILLGIFIIRKNEKY